MYLIKTKIGTFIPMDSADTDEANKIPPGDVVNAKRSRNFKFHKKMFALFKLAFENQSKYQSFQVFRKVLLLKAGYYDEIPDKNGKPYYIPQSLSYDSMSADTFEECYNVIIDVVSKELDAAPKMIRTEVEKFY